MFDMSTGVVRTKLLTDKAQGDGFPVHKDPPDFVKKAINILGSQVTNRLWKSGGKRLGEKPMKLLIAQELSNTIELKEKPPNVVAKLMGLNSLPVQQKVPPSKKSLQANYSYHFSNKTIPRQQGEYYYNKMKYRSDIHIDEMSFKNVYEVKQKLPSVVQLENENSLCTERYHENLAEKRMALVHQKFLEAKRLATNERLLKSKEFKEALDVLSSNRDLFLKLLEEPNSLFSNQLKELNQTISLGSQTKCITVLKPTTSAGMDHEKSTSKKRSICGEEIMGFDGHDWSSGKFIPKSEVASKPTRIVVLKASTEMPPESRNMNGDFIIDEDLRSREIVKEITYQVQKGLRSKQKDVYQKATDLSNVYPGDGASLNMSEDDYGEEGGSEGNDSELMTPTSRNSWVHMRSGDPVSPSTFSPASYSFESTVSREAKKRLSDRWESVISNDINLEFTDVRKNSSTLGEMLAISEVKKEEKAVDKLAISPLVSNHQEHYMSIARSKSLPSSLYYENFKEKEEISRTQSGKSVLLKQVTKVKNVKLSFKEKVSGLLVSKIKTLVKDKPRLLSSVSSDGRLDEINSSAVKDDNLVKYSNSRISDRNTSKTLEEKIVKFLSPISISGAEKHGKGFHTIDKLRNSGVSRENCNQSRYISALERTLQEDFLGNISRSSQTANICNPQALSRSPIISSISRSSNRESSHSDTVPSNSFKLFRLFSKEDEDQKRFDFFTKLLLCSNLANERSTALLAKSYSLDNPLNPSLLDEFLDRKGEEAKCRERRSNQMLYFDSINAALKDICLCSLVNAYPWSTTISTYKHVKTNLSVRDAVWFHIKDNFCVEENCTSGKAENSEKYVDNLVKKDVAESGLAESMWLEMDELSKEIVEQMLEELFDDAPTDLTRAV